ncbi:MAG: hypothetical protein WBB74_05010 [Gaiellaceae bacterium]
MAEREPTVVETAQGRVEIAFGVNRWVLVTTPAGSAQAQVNEEAELANVLRDEGVPARDAYRAAAEAWARRPRDARFKIARPGEHIWRGTGLSRRGLATLLVLFVIAAVVLTVLAAQR